MKHGRKAESGQTLALVAVSMISFIAMAALAIDLTSLYSAKSEIQRAADAAALAGAKAFVDSGIVTDPTNSTLQNLAQNMAQSYAAGVATQNLVADAPAQLAGPPVVDLSLQGNPRVIVKVERTGLPLFFARIWGNNFGAVSATAVAEAYNPAFSESNGSSFVPSAPKCVKPILIPNDDPQSNLAFVDTTSGAVTTTNGVQFIGEQISFTTACKAGRGKAKGCQLPGISPIKAGQYIPMLVGSAHQYCPASSAAGCAGGGTDFEQSIECCDGSAFNAPQCGTSTTFASWDPNTDPKGVGSGSSPVTAGLQCLIHSPGGNSQQDTIDPTAFASGSGPLLISPGAFSQARYNIPSTAFIGTSDSIITVPLFDNSGTLPANNQLTIVGFLTLFVNDANGSSGDFNATIVNVTGCGSTPSSVPPVSGGGVSAIPVRLIHN